MRRPQGGSNRPIAEPSGSPGNARRPRGPPGTGRWPRRRLLLAAAPLLIVLAVSAMPGALPWAAGPTAAPAPHDVAGAAEHALATKPTPHAVVTLGASADPTEICGGDVPTCPAGAGESTVTLSAKAGVKGENEWPAAQILFLLETTPYDGVYDPSAGVPGSDPCGDSEIGSSPLCDESNAVPFFVQNAGPIAVALQSEYPNTTLSFSLVDYFATHDAWDSGGGATYHVDVGSFVNDTEFGRSVVETFQRTLLGGGYIIPNSDLLENFLDSDSISAMYAAIGGWGGLNWSNATHHVIVQVGSTAPRDPNYAEDYCVSPAVTPHGLTNCTAPTCEPITTILRNLTPECEGWILSSTGDPSDTIAAYAHNAPTCSGSLGGNCTVDEIDLNATPTNPSSPSWSAAGGSGGPANWTLDASNILESGCDMASSTGGTWAGPTWFTCRSLGTRGSLGYVPIVDPAQPRTSNPSLLGAFTRIGLGTVPTPVVAAGTDQPMFQFLPWGNFAVAPVPQFKVICTNATGAPKNCPSQPMFSVVAGVPAYSWNWSNQAFFNQMLLGDTWTVTFQVDAFGPPFGILPVDACATLGCLDAGSGGIAGEFSAMTFREYGGANVLTISFPLITIAVDPVEITQVPVAPLAPVEPGPLPPSAVAPSAPLVPPTPAPPIPAAAISVEAAAAGFIAAGMIRMGIRQPPMATRHASLSGALGGKRRKRSHDAPIGRWE